MAKNSHPLITEMPVTAESREAWLRELFEDELPKSGELFVPTDRFYANALPGARARTMMRQLCEWVGVKPGYITLSFESNTYDHPDGSRYTVFVEAEVAHDEFVLGGFLAYSLTRYLLEERKGIRLVAEDQAILLAHATILFGFGLVVMNGINPTYGWIHTWRHMKSFLLKGFPLPNYTHMFKNYLRQNSILSRHYAASLTPWAAQRLGQRQSRKPIYAVNLARHHVRIVNLKTVGICWLIVFVVGLSIYVGFQRAQPLSPAAQTAEQEMNRLFELTKICNDSLAYERQYADLSDLQSERALNATAARCKSLTNQYESAAQTYRSLIN